MYRWLIIIVVIMTATPPTSPYNRA